GDDLLALLHPQPDADADAQRDRRQWIRLDVLAPALGKQFFDLVQQGFRSFLGDLCSEVRRAAAQRIFLEIESRRRSLVILRRLSRHRHSSSRRSSSPIRNPTPTEIKSALPGFERTYVRT